MLTTLGEMYITLLPAIFAGVLNMIWCKLPVAKALAAPIDGGRTLRDGRPVFGGNKTYKGFVGMIIFGCIFTVLWGLVCGSGGYLFEHNYIYRSHGNTVPYNAVMGVLFGFAYALFELPNSFIKRRIGIEPGKPLVGGKAAIFVFLDQADSVFGMALVVAMVYPMSLWFYLCYVLVGAATHIVINMLLYAAHLRANPF